MSAEPVQTAAPAATDAVVAAPAAAVAAPATAVAAPDVAVAAPDAGVGGGGSVKRPTSADGAAAAISPAKRQRLLAEAELAKLTGAERISALRRQIEYYLSDQNMVTDLFFHMKISEGQDGWLPLAFILSSRKIKALAATEEDIAFALRESESVEFRPSPPPAAGGEGPAGAAGTAGAAARAAAAPPPPCAAVRRRGGAPLPPLSEDVRAKRAARNAGHAGGGPGAPGPRTPRGKEMALRPQHPEEIHTLGVLLRVTKVPEEVNWTQIKDALKEKFDEAPPADSAAGPPATGGGADAGAAAAKNEGQSEAETKPTGRQSRVRFVSNVTPEGCCYIYLRKFAGDYEKATGIKQVEVGATQLPVELVNDPELAAKVFSTSLPPAYRREREREWAELRTLHASRPVTVGGTKFESIEHLRRCCKEFIEKATIGDNLKPTPYKVLRGLLDYHPKKEKAVGVVAIKVDELSAEKAKSGRGGCGRCFFLIRQDGSQDDFSYLKCLEGVRRNPPFTETLPVEEADTAASSDN